MPASLAVRSAVLVALAASPVLAPRSAHGLSRNGPPWLLVDRLEQIRTWFAHWIGTGTTPGRAGQQD